MDIVWHNCGPLAGGVMKRSKRHWSRVVLLDCAKGKIAIKMNFIDDLRILLSLFDILSLVTKFQSI